MTEEQVLKLTGKEFSRVAGNILKNGNVNRKVVPEGWYNHDLKSGVCNKCKQYIDGKSFCPTADPIPLTPDNAFRWRDRAVEKHGAETFHVCLHAICVENGGYQRPIERYSVWISTTPEPADYIKAAVLCELRTQQQ